MSGEKKDVLHETAEFVTVDSLMDENRALRQQRDRLKEIAEEALDRWEHELLLWGPSRKTDKEAVAAYRKELYGE